MRSQPLCVLTLLVAAGCARLSSVDLPAPQEAPLVESLRPDSAGRFLVKLASPAYLTAIAYDGRSQPLVFYVDDVPSQPPAPGVEPVAIGVPRLPAPRWNPAYVGFTSGRPLCSAQLEGTISTEQGLRPSYGYVCDGPSGGTTPLWSSHFPIGPGSAHHRSHRGLPLPSPGGPLGDGPQRQVPRRLQPDSVRWHSRLPSGYPRPDLVVSGPWTRAPASGAARPVPLIGNGHLANDPMHRTGPIGHREVDPHPERRVGNDSQTPLPGHREAAIEERHGVHPGTIPHERLVLLVRTH